MTEPIQRSVTIYQGKIKELNLRNGHINIRIAGELADLKELLAFIGAVDGIVDIVLVNFEAVDGG